MYVANPSRPGHSQYIKKAVDCYDWRSEVNKLALKQQIPDPDTVKDLHLSYIHMTCMWLF
ncbi:hypothetical protein DSL64_03690 [Dyadobacter luteus]|uniref:Uncharacterized protein n=1 Tax=Dyadobacter luteus TaxID=2259619 RepID=A0A3D8YGR1_9BACT|nr:hypothetical protein DSL64_03690 [Dyadobacter luteus]